jgi:outer membrane protein
MLMRFLLTICLLFSGSLFAAHPLTLAELVNIALENHPSTKQAWWNANRAAAALGSAKSAYYPFMGIEANAQNGRDYKFINGPDAHYTIVGADLVLSMLLYDFGERCAAVDSAKMSLLAARWQMDWNIQKVMLKVLENAYAILHAQAALDATVCSMQEVEKILKIARELNRVGLTPVSDIYASQATFFQMKMDLAQKKAQLDIQKGKLISSLGLSIEFPLELAPIDTPQIQTIQKIEELRSLAFQQRADLMAKQARLSESMARQAGAKAAYGPKVSLSGRGGVNHYFHDKASGGQYQINLNLEMPLFDGFETLYNNRVAYADTNLGMEELSELQLEIALEVLTTARSLEAAQEMLPHASENLKNAAKAYEGVLDKYKAGKERIVDVSHAQRQLADARILYSEAKTQWLAAMARLAYATGTMAPYTETPCENP